MRETLYNSNYFVSIDPIKFTVLMETDPLDDSNYLLDKEAQKAKEFAQPALTALA
jgi:hypothetical protein